MILGEKVKCISRDWLKVSFERSEVSSWTPDEVLSRSRAAAAAEADEEAGVDVAR